MKKICEIDTITVYSKTGITYNKRSVWRKTRHIQPSLEWLEAALLPAQLKFIEDKNPVFRPHPKHNPTMELFVDETMLDERDWTVLHLLF
jgi:hypothetical protein